jgi:hypothetical protein
VKQWPVVFPSHAFQERFEISVKPDRYALFSDPRSGARVHKGAPASGEHRLGAIQQAHNDATFAIAKIAFAVFGENLRDGQTGGGCDNLGVCVYEWQSQSRSKTVANGAFARPHHANENN